MTTPSPRESSGPSPAAAPPSSVPPPSGPAGPPVSPELPRLRLGPHFEMHPVVFPAGATIVLLLVGLTAALPVDDLRAAFAGARDWIGTRFGWLYVASMTGFLGFVLWLAFGRFGRVRLGRDDERPEFGTAAWFSMLFSAGMGIGLVFWSVAEPIHHLGTTPPGFAEGLDPSRLSMAVTIFHWGLHPWALYAVVGLALAYVGFRRDMPLGFRSLLHPLLGDRVWGRTGDVVDTLAIIATLTGVATSLGIGAQQVNAGLAFLFDLPTGIGVQVGIVAAITAVATVSVVLGLAAGIRRLSQVNMLLAAALMLLVVLGSGVVAFLGAFVENAGAYLQVLPFSAFRTGAFGAEGSSWLSGWTVFYWAWWISWSPFVGMFIARISRGRTIREFVVGVLLVPTVVGIGWLTAFGTTTLRQHERHVDPEVPDAVAIADEDLPLYDVAVLDADGSIMRAEDGRPIVEARALTAVEFLDAPVIDAHGEPVEQLPTVLFALLEGVLSAEALVLLAAGTATLCIVLFFVTSSDSASLVIDIVASGGNPDPPVGTRLFWALAEGAVAAALLVAGGLEALQAASITAALPFTVILVLACIGLVRALVDDERERLRFERAVARRAPASAGDRGGAAEGGRMPADATD